jgi:hypothetical protein
MFAMILGGKQNRSHHIALNPFALNGSPNYAVETIKEAGIVRLIQEYTDFPIFNCFIHSKTLESSILSGYGRFSW